ncbi:MAG: hypothetical protein ACREJC_12950 [Tepidisphaeraceae bacterium]
MSQWALMMPQDVAIRLAFVTAMIGALGCQPSRRAPAPNAAPMVMRRPLIDFARGAGGFPLADNTMPESAQQLVRSLTRGYSRRVKFREGVAPVIICADQFPSLESLFVDLSGAEILPDYRPTLLPKGTVPGAEIFVAELEYVATPLRYDEGRTDLRIVARDAKLALLNGGGEGSVLVMTEASGGSADFQVAVSDLRTMFLASMRTAGARFGYMVTGLNLTIDSPNPRSLSCAIDVSGWWLLLPTSFRLSGRLDVDEQFMGHLSGVSCKGTDVGGALAAGFIDASLGKYDGKIMPVARFAGGKIRLRDLSIRVDDSVRIHARFGS